MNLNQKYKNNYDGTVFKNEKTFTFNIQKHQKFQNLYFVPNF